MSLTLRAVNSDISCFDFVAEAYLVVSRFSFFYNCFNFDAASVFVTCDGYLIRIDIVLDGFSGIEIAVFISANGAVFLDVYHIFGRLIILFFRFNGNLAVRCRFYSDFVSRDSLLQFVQLSAVYCC